MHVENKYDLEEAGHICYCGAWLHEDAHIKMSMKPVRPTRKAALFDDDPELSRSSAPKLDVTAKPT